MAEKRFSKTAEAVKNLWDFSVSAELAHIPVGSLFQFCLRLSGGEKQRISIAHKLTSLRNAGQILVLENGHIVQRCIHEELIKEEGLYRKF